MSSPFIQSISIDWDRIAEDSYLRNMESLCGLRQMVFTNPITFFVGENGSGKSTILEAIAVASGFNPEGGPKNYNFSTYDLIRSFGRPFGFPEGTKRPGGDTFFVRKAFIT